MSGFELSSGGHDPAGLPSAGAPPASPAPSEPRAAAVLGARLTAAVDQAVLARVQQEASALAADAFEEMLTPELAIALRDRAHTSAATLLDLAAGGTRFANVAEWVEQFLSTMIVRWPSQDFLWCPQWWSHGEVVSRLTGLWITWEKARLGDAADINTWWLQQLDPHLAVITALGGPLTGCNQNDGHGGERAGLLVIPVPPGSFGPTQTTATA
jgi:hypothetical protein